MRILVNSQFRMSCISVSYLKIEDYSNKTINFGCCFHGCEIRSLIPREEHTYKDKALIMQLSLGIIHC
jgi:hypothetical protein